MRPFWSVHKVVDRLVSLVLLTLFLLAFLSWSFPASAQSAPVKFFSAASLNPQVVLAGNVLLKTGVVINTTTTVYYIKFYNKATAPTCGTDIPKWTVPIPFGASSAGGGFTLPIPDGLMFPAGLGFCITGGIADNDVTNAATGIVVNLGVSKR